jgi:hypothetical protein
MTSIFITRFINRWLKSCLLFFVAGCAARSENGVSKSILKQEQTNEVRLLDAIDAINSTFPLVKNGDLVVRCGRDATSYIMRNLSDGDKSWSHCGIAFWENDSLMVYHALGGEWNPAMKLRRDPFSVFSNPWENRSFGIYRYSLSNKENNSLRNIVQKYYYSQIPFDMQFDLGTDDKMYCSELVKKSLEEATHYRLQIPVEEIQERKIVGVGNLLIPGCTLVKKVNFSFR